MSPTGPAATLRPDVLAAIAQAFEGTERAELVREALGTAAYAEEYVDEHFQPLLLVLDADLLKERTAPPRYGTRSKRLARSGTGRCGGCQTGGGTKRARA